MTKDAPAFDFFPERFWFAVEGWTDAEIVRYWRLLSQQWMRDGLPADERELSALARGKVSARVLEKFPVGEDGQRRNSFLEKLRQEQRGRIERAQERGRKMAAGRWSKHSSSDAQAMHTAMHTASDKQCLMNAHHPPPTTHPIIDTLPAGDGSGIPPVTLEQAKANAGQHQATPEIAEKWWLDQDARGWLDGRGQPITRPWSHLRSYAISWRSNDAKSQTSRFARPEAGITPSAKEPGYDF